MSVTYIPASLRRMVRERAHDQCEYCLLPESVSINVHCVDHIVAEKHGGATSEANLALACQECNQRKASDIASIDIDTGETISLFDPRKLKWEDHFFLVGGQMEPLSQIAKVTIRFLRLNDDVRVIIRGLLIENGQLRIPGIDASS